MKLSLSILSYYLNDFVKVNSPIITEHSLQLSRPVFFAGENELISNTLYISHSSWLPDQLIFSSGSALITLGTPPDSYFSERQLLIIEEDSDILWLSNEINRIYDFFDSWENNLLIIHQEQKSLQSLCDITESIFSNDVSVMNADFIILAQTHLQISLSLNLDTSGALPISQINAFKDDPDYKRIRDEKSVFLYPDRIIPNQALCKNIFYQDQFVFRIIVMENMHPFRPFDKELLEFFSGFFDSLAEDYTTSQRIENQTLKIILESGIQGDFTPLSVHEQELKKIGWLPSHSYTLCRIQPSNEDIYHTTLSYFCSKIMRNFNQTIAFIKDGFLVVIFNQSIAQNKEATQTFEDFIWDSHFKAGFSNPFQNLLNLKDAFLESTVALEIGNHNNPDQAVHRFSSHLLSYLLNRITSELPASRLYALALHRLSAYDQLNGTDYLNTLRVYLKNNMNAVKTAKELIIHRGTILYRLDRIRSIGQIDLKNEDERLHLLISFKLAEASGFTPSRN